MTIDLSGGWNDAADRFMAARSNVGAALVRNWADAHLPAGGDVLDLGCGSGVPIAQALFDRGFELFGIDASARLIAAFDQRFPDAHSACEAAQDSAFFNRRFDAVIAIGLLFLLDRQAQETIIQAVGSALKPGGRFLFSAPIEPCEWPDMLTGRRSLSLGAQGYEPLLRASVLRAMGRHADEGGNTYFDTMKPTA